MPIRIFVLCLTLLVSTAHAREGWPASRDAVTTTDGTIYLGNLDARIAVLEALQARRPDSASAASLAGALYHRYRIRGRLADAERAFALADLAVAAPEARAEAFVLRASLRSGFHLFDQAAADLDAAQTRGMRADALRAARRELALAVGNYALLRDDFVAARKAAVTGFDDLALAAHLRDLQGDTAGAEGLYARAQDAYADSSPVPLAWLYVQQGAMLLEAGDPARARPFFQAAYDRLPGYTLATEHLAETEALLGRTERARALYREAIEASGDPAFIDALARIEREAGHIDMARQLDAQARDGWETRLARYPQAYSMHAVDYFLDRAEPQRALALATDNAKLRRDVGSLVLLARAADAAGDTAQACGAWRDARATGLSTAPLRALDSYARHCP